MHCVNKHTIFIVNTVPFDLNDTLFTSTLTFPSILTCKYPQRSKRSLEVIQFAAIVSQPHNLNCAYIYVLHEVYFPFFFIRNVLWHVLLWGWKFILFVWTLGSLWMVTIYGSVAVTLDGFWTPFLQVSATSLLPSKSPPTSQQ